MGPALTQASEEDIDKWGEGMKKWQEENSHLPGLQEVSTIVSNIKARRTQMLNQQKNQANAGQPVSGQLPPDVLARLQRLEQKLDKLIKHLGVK